MRKAGRGHPGVGVFLQVQQPAFAGLVAEVMVEARVLARRGPCIGYPDGSCSIYVGRRAGDGKEVPLRFNLIDRVLEPKDDGALTAGHTALSVLVGEILKRPSSK